MIRHAQPVAVMELEGTRSKRRRAAATPEWPAKPLGLSAEERALLSDWAGSSTAQRKWDRLLQQAGVARLELAERMSGKLLALGVWAVREQFERAAWRLAEIYWCDLTALQRELGLETAADKLAKKADIDAQLSQLLEDELVAEVAAAVLAAPLAASIKRARAELLAGLSLWLKSQSSGLRQDFALHARPHTKAVSPSEWAWLEQCFDLASLGIGRFKAMLWLAADCGLSWADGELDLQALPLLALPCESLAGLRGIKRAPSHYWLIENRASFERQADARVPGCCLVWTAGRPSHAWLRAIQVLLHHAPAPAFVSADADPAGVEIALAASEPWRAAGLPWEPRAMDAELLRGAKRQPLNGYDERCLQGLLGQKNLPPTLMALLACMQDLRGKAEQEAWL